MQTITKLIIAVLLIAALAFVGGYRAGMQYQKQQTPIEYIDPLVAHIVYYSGDKIVDDVWLPVNPGFDSFGMFTNSTFVRENNITAYWVYLHST